MQAEFWIERWRDGRIGFHEGQPNRFLVRHGERLGERRRVLVPLCGKTDDLAWLAERGHSVVGIELVEDAVRAFFEEHRVTPTVRQRGSHIEYTAGEITVFAGDLLAASANLIGPIDAVYDRAALVAMPPELRPRYAAHVRSLVGPGSPGLVVTLEYPHDQMVGPPFSVSETELRESYGTATLLDQAPDDRLRERGATAIERCWAVTLPIQRP